MLSGAWLLAGFFACEGETPGRTDGPPVLTLEPRLDGLAAPIGLATDGAGGTYVVDQAGLVYDLDAGPSAPILDLREALVPLDPAGDPRGLLGFAFHPAWPADPRVFAWYTTPGTSLPTGYDHANRLSSFTFSQGAVDLASETVLLELPYPGRDHNGAGPEFGLNGLLFLAIGDGGGAGDSGLGHPPEGNGQNTDTLLGAILRVDVDLATPYAIPPDNPFADGGGAPEIYAWGFHDPTGLAVDARTGELYATDAGQSLLEEVNVVHGGGNYGWNLREGTLCFDRQRPDVPLPTCPSFGAAGEPFVAPILTFPHPASHVVGDGQAGDGVAGARVVRGQPMRADSLPAWEGHYLFGTAIEEEGAADGALFLGNRRDEDWRSERVWVGDTDDGELDGRLLGVAADAAGEVYVLTTDEPGPTGTSGRVRRVVAEE